MSSVTFSASGTALLRQLAAEGKLPASGSGPFNPASLVANGSSSTGAAQSSQSAQSTQLPTTIQDLIKLQENAAKQKDPNAVNQIQQQIANLQADNGLPSSGNVINVQA